VLISAANLAKKFGLSTRMLQDLVAIGAIPKAVSTRGWDEDAAILSYVTYLRQRAAGRVHSADSANETVLLKAEQRKNMALRNAVLEGSLIPVDAIRPGWERVARAVQTAVMSAPGAIRFRLPHLTLYDEQTIEEVLRDQLADAGMGLEPPEIETEEEVNE
jgi:phage terminase Nu1 subunit (DNA packaging protein)